MRFLKSLSVFLGTVIGVGIFGLPFVAMKAGFFVAFVYLFFAVLISISVNFIFGEIALGTAGVHRLPGYVGKYLGRGWKGLAFLGAIVGIMGALLAYLIVGGQFLYYLLSPYLGGAPLLFSLLFFVPGAFLVWKGIKSISGVELAFLAGLLIILLLFFFKSLPFINLDNFKGINLRSLALPYGVIIFSLWGTALIPEIKEMLIGSGKNKARKQIRKVIFWGIIFSALVYLFFIFIVLGSSGINTSKEAISGLKGTLGRAVYLGFVFGALACFTSFITLGLTLKKVFWYDFNIPKNLSWGLTCLVPLILFLLGIREFIEVIGFCGAVALGIEGIIIVFLYRAFLNKKFSRKMNPLFYFLIVAFSLGIVLEAVYFLSK